MRCAKQVVRIEVVARNDIRSVGRIGATVTDRLRDAVESEAVVRARWAGSVQTGQTCAVVAIEAITATSI